MEFFVGAAPPPPLLQPQWVSRSKLNFGFRGHDFAAKIPAVAKTTVNAAMLCQSMPVR